MHNLSIFFLSCLLTLPLVAMPVDLDAWVEVETPHFTLFTDAEPARGAEVALGLERFRAVFARLAPALELRSPAPTTIVAFRDGRSFAPYKSRADDGHSTILGQFLSHPDGNYLTLDAGEHRVGSLAVIYHEYVHYFVRHNFLRVPLWFNEGLAEYYSTFVVEDDSVRVGLPVERHVQWLQREGEIDLATVLAVDRHSPDYREGDKAGRFYAVSWALVHYLLSGDGERLDQMADYLLRVGDGEDGEDAFEEAFGRRLSSLEEDLSRYVQTGEFSAASIPTGRLGVSAAARVRPMAAGDTLYRLGDLLAHMGRASAAEDHLQLALEFDPGHPDVHAGLALVRNLQNRWPEADVLYRDALERGSQSALTHLTYGRHLLAALPSLTEPERSQAAATVRAVLRRATEIDGDYAEAWALFGHAHLYGDIDAAAGIRALEKALRWLPERVDHAFRLLHLLIEDGQFRRASALVERALVGRADPQAVDRAREEITRGELLARSRQAFADEDVEEGLRFFDEAVSATSDPELRQRMEEELRQLQDRYAG